MFRRIAPGIAAAVALCLAPSPLAAQEDPPLGSWQAAPYWAPAEARPDSPDRDRGPKAAYASAGTIGMKDVLVVTPLPLVAIPPCRLADTRSTSPFLPGSGYGPPSMPGVHAQRTFAITGQCGIPAGAAAVSFNFTVWAPVTRGDIRVFPAGVATPSVATLNWEANILALANAAIVPLGTGGAITVQVDGPGTIDLIVDVNGYFAPQNSFCMGADCRTSWNGQDANSVTPLPRTCPAGQIPISTGAYQWTCTDFCQTPGIAFCSGTGCTSLNTDPNNCGACGVHCASGATCVTGSCQCPAGYTVCGALCVNLASDPNNCGACGNACTSGQICSSGSCSVIICAQDADCPSGHVCLSGICF